MVFTDMLITGTTDFVKKYENLIGDGISAR